MQVRIINHIDNSDKVDTPDMERVESKIMANICYPFNPFHVAGLFLYSLKCNPGPNIFKSSRQRCSVRKGVLRIFTKSTGKHLCKISKKTSFTKHL